MVSEITMYKCDCCEMKYETSCEASQCESEHYKEGDYYLNNYYKHTNIWQIEYIIPYRCAFSEKDLLFKCTVFRFDFTNNLHEIISRDYTKSELNHFIKQYDKDVVGSFCAEKHNSAYCVVDKIETGRMLAEAFQKYIIDMSMKTEGRHRP